MMKKAVSVVLACALAACAAPVSVSAAENAVRFAVASDLHYNPTEDELDRTNDDPVYWYANRRAALEEESGFIIDEFLSQCARDDSVEFVLISGDLADDGRSRPEDHRTVAEKLAAFEAESGKQVYVINGNHDAAADSATTYDVFKEIYADFGYDRALTVTDYDCSYTADLGEKYRLIALDSNNPHASTEDGLTVRKVLWVRDQAEQAKRDGRYPVVMMHHNLLDHLPAQRLLSHDFIVRFHRTVASLFASWGVRLVLTGHEHCSDAAKFTDAAGNVIYDLATTSLTMYPTTYRALTLTDDEIVWESRVVDSIDCDALLAAQSALGEEQKAAMERGLNEYSRGFLKVGVEYRLALGLTDEKLGVSESDFYYPLVRQAVDGLTGILSAPLYGEGGVSELAAKYGMEIPASDYENLWDLATDLVAMHYAGSEKVTLDSAEVAILLRGVSLILKDDLSNLNDYTALSLATRLLESRGMSGITNELTALTSRVFGGVRPDEYLAAALLAPFLYEFAYDSDGVDDNDASAPGYGVTDRAGKMGDAFLAKFRKLVDYIRLSFAFIAKIFH